MVKNTVLSAILIIACISFVSAQSFSYGFKAGLNFSRINASDLEQLNGEDLESYSQNSGFHLGVIVDSKFTDYFGVSCEFLFSQKGGRYDYSGPSYAELNSIVGEDRVTRVGDRSMNLNLSNSYFDIPVSVYVRPVKWFEVSAGVSAAFLISSTASGELEFREMSQSDDDAYRGISLDYRYFSDEIGEADLDSGSEVRMINGVSLEMPKTQNAYYDYPDGAETGLYNRLDLGVHAGVKFFINKSLFVGGRVNIGLSDITNEEVDRAYLEKDTNNDFIYRDDKDTNLSIQASIGFSF